MQQALEQAVLPDRLTRFPSARWTRTSGRWALSRSGSLATALGRPPAPRARRPSSASRSQSTSSACSRSWRNRSRRGTPVVVPVRQQVALERDAVELEISEVGAVECAPETILGLGEITETRARGAAAARVSRPASCVRAEVARAPTGGWRARGSRASRARASRDVRALDRTVVRRDERDHALRAHRERHRHAVADQIESTQQRQPRGSRSRRTPRRPGSRPNRRSSIRLRPNALLPHVR